MDQNPQNSGIAFSGRMFGNLDFRFNLFLETANAPGRIGLSLDSWVLDPATQVVAAHEWSFLGTRLLLNAVKASPGSPYTRINLGLCH